MIELKARLSTGEHILARVLQNKVSDLKVRIAKFFEDYGQAEFLSEKDLRDFTKEELNDEINSIVAKNLIVKKEVVSRKDADKFLDLSRLNFEIKEVRVISIGNFDCRACGDPHVDNTSEIGVFEIFKVKKVGAGRYRYQFRVK